MSVTRLMKGAFAVAALLAVAFAAARARAGSGTGTLAGDTFVNSAAASANNNMGASAGIVVGASSTDASTLHGLIRFNVPANLAGRVTVTGTTVTLTVASQGNAQNQGTKGPATYSLFRITQNWFEGNGSNDIAGQFIHGSSCAGVAGASWNQAVCSTGTNWTTAGGTSVGSASAAADSTPVGVNGVLSFSSGVCAGTNLTCDVQGWIDSGSPFGWLIVSNNGTAGTAQKFYSKEGSAGQEATLSFNFSCKGTLADLGSFCTTCNTAANNDCVTSHPGNSCNDAGPPSATYSCTCDPSLYKNGTGSDGKPACVFGCSPTNHCRDGGDATAACADTAGGYSCTCDSGFILGSNAFGPTCVSACPGTPDPCGAGIGSCTPVAGGWTCACNAGYGSTGGAHPSCVNFNACTAAAIADCTTFPSNSCVDEAPPSVNYHCSCGNAAFTTGTGSDGKPACVHIDYCTPNHCRDGGDTGSTCTNSTGINTGYTCACSNNTFWTQQVVGGFNTCVDVNECAAGNPCGAGLGTCTNVALGGGYTCTCAPGYVSSGGTTPHCFHPTVCDAAANASCATNKAGNTCVVKPAPSLGHVCTCGNAAYVASADLSSCVVKPPSCDVNHCIDRGDPSGACVAELSAPNGYVCTCGAGFRFDGASCADVDECLSGGNPCGRGTCNNFLGGYSCLCESGFHQAGAPPTCVADVVPTDVQVTTSGGTGCSCDVSRSHSPIAPLAPLALAGALLALALLRRRARRAAPQGDPR